MAPKATFNNWLRELTDFVSGWSNVKYKAHYPQENVILPPLRVKLSMKTMVKNGTGFCIWKVFFSELSNINLKDVRRTTNWWK